MTKLQVIYKELSRDDCKVDLLKDFNRYQEVNRCWRNENGDLILKDIHFVEQWDDAEKEEELSSLIGIIEGGGAAIGAFAKDRMIGFAAVCSESFGLNNEYVQLSSLHVSFEGRNSGIGRRLFDISCDKARQLGAHKLYISAHSSEETQGFYKSVGCINAQEVNRILAEKEPFDCQLEFAL